MITLSALDGAACADVDVDPLLFDPECHNHLRLGRGNSCWLCEEAEMVCEGCPVLQECFDRAVKWKESYMICAGMLWSGGRPRDVRRRRS